MNPRSDQEIDALLAAHFQQVLGPHAGRSAASFSRYIHRQRIFRFTLATAAAAMITIVALVAVDRLRNPTAPSPSRSIASLPTTPPVERLQPIMHQAAWSPLRDDGLRIIDDVPVRQLRRDYVEEFQWYDPAARATIKTTVPRQQIILIGVKTD